MSEESQSTDWRAVARDWLAGEAAMYRRLDELNLDLFREFIGPSDLPDSKFTEPDIEPN